MSEEEIIKILNSYTTDLYHSYKEDVILKAIRGLLDLYNKEKEKNKELSIKVTEQIINRVEVELLEEYRQKLKNSISKDKIREKIKEYQELVNDFQEYWSKDPRKFTKEKSIDYYKIEALKELLEE